MIPSNLQQRITDSIIKSAADIGAQLAKEIGAEKSAPISVGPGETVLVIRHAFTDKFIREQVKQCLAEYGVEVESVELMGGAREVAA